LSHLTASPGGATAALILGVLVVSALWSAPSCSLAANSPRFANDSYLLSAASCFYNATASGNWNDPSVWSSTPVAPFPNTLPAGCGVNIPAGTAVTIPDGLSVVVLGSVQNSASLVVNEYASITFKDSGTLNNEVHGSVSTSVGSTIDNQGGVINNEAGSQITLGDSATFYNRAGSVISNTGAITVQADAEFLIEGGNVTNSGSISDRGLVENYLGGMITNSGTINDESALYNSGAVDNAGSISNTGTIRNNGTITGLGSIEGGRVIPATLVSCSPSPAPANSQASCTVRMMGTMDSTNGEIVSFASSSGTGTFIESASCALSSGSCYVMYTDPVAGSLVISAAYPGDSHDGVSSGNTTIVVKPTVSASSSTSAGPQTIAAATTSASGGPGLPLTYLIGAAAVVAIIISSALAGRARGHRSSSSVQ